MGKFENTELKIWKKAFDINFYGSLYFYKNILPIMKKNKYGRIVQITGGGQLLHFQCFHHMPLQKRR
jgi:NADP-dependent 3-hydroxy acid dehydrogenase YdfG